MPNQENKCPYNQIDCNEVLGIGICECGLADDMNPKQIADIHTEHCCAMHGCKYQDKDCTVEFGNKLGTSPCVRCKYWLRQFHMF